MFSLHSSSAYHLFFLIISRLCELSLLKYYRSKGRNSSTVVFVGNDPAVGEMYRTMTEDPSAGYIVKGYYADADMVNAPEGLNRIGTMQDFNKNMSSTINNTIYGTPNSIDEVFCCLSHTESDQIVKIMQFCDKNVVHFYFLPRVSANISCISMPRTSWAERYIPTIRSRWLAFPTAS